VKAARVLKTTDVKCIANYGWDQGRQCDGKADGLKRYNGESAAVDAV